ncbi:hypothetical protein LUZ62_039515 [Rhynchospora pubera]|uniref:E3 UFM1-protein ligase 1 n=1 Tax=Rhynchospora pubera TaxID=906938 RepID=A0AAV8F579_9POAL|nr:hypothetical protein LUZ62_039515 [Rhynchospora pubera]
MDAELLELQRQLEAAQQAKPSVRLSERNVVELVHKLQEHRFFDFDLLHTVTGKEYITPDQLKREMEIEINRSGRVSLIDLADIIGVDLYYIERQAERIIAEDASLMMVHGEIISQSYWDSVAEEINEKLQECSQMSLAEIAAHLHVGSELVISFLEPRLGTLVKGRLEGGQIYTPAYVQRITAMVRGATRGITVPTNLPIVWNSLQQLLQDIDGASGVSVEGTFFQSIFNGLLKEEAVLGSLRAGVQWTPAVFAHAQRECVDSFFSQNSYISYDVLHKLAIPQPKQYLQTRYPDGIPLEAVFVHPSMVDMLEAAVSDAIDQGNWIDCLSVLPSYIVGADASKLLSFCPSLQKAAKSSSAVILGDSCVISNAFIKGIFDKLEKELDTFIFATNQTKNPKNGPISQQQAESKDADNDEGNNANVPEKGKKRRGKTAKGGNFDKDEDAQELVPAKGKKNQRKSKDVGSTGGKKGSDKVKEENSNVPVEWVVEKITSLCPELEEMGDSEELIRQLALHLRPMLLDYYKKRKNTLLSENAERRRRLLDSLQKHLDEAVLDLQMYEKALDLFEDDSSTSAILHKHLLKTMAAPIADKLLHTLDMDNKLKNGVEVIDSPNETLQLSNADRTSMAKSLAGSLSAMAQSLVEALEGKRVDAFMDALRAVAEESGLLVKKLDKRVERSMLHSYRKDLTTQVSSETDSIALLPKVVALLFMQVHNKAIQAPGRAISSLISHLKEKVPHTTFKLLTDYHNATVTLLSLQAAATGAEDEDCLDDRVLTKKEFLEEKMSELKSLTLGSTNSEN